MLPLPILFLRALPSRLGLNQQNAWDRYHQEHRRPAGLAGGLLARLLRWELSRLEAGRTMPAGGSILVAAQREPA